MNTTSRKGFRAASSLVLLVGGAGVAAAVWVGGSRTWAISTSVAYIVLAVVAYVWAGRAGDIAAILRVGTDERQRELDWDATALTGLILIVTSVVGAIVSVARNGGTGQFGVMCVIAGVSYTASLVYLKSRR